jgi:hypothetical protein
MMFDNLLPILCLVVLAVGFTLAFLFYLLMYRYILSGKPHSSTLHTTGNIPAPPDVLKPLNEMLRAQGYHFIGAETNQTYSFSSPYTAYVYLSEKGDTYAELGAPGGTAQLMLHTRFQDEARIITSYPLGQVLKAPELLAHYAAHDPQVIFPHHHEAVREWTWQKSAPVRLRSWAEVKAEDIRFLSSKARRLFFRSARYTRLVMLALYSIGGLLCWVELFSTFNGGRASARTIMALLTILFPVIDMVLLNWALKPANPLDKGAIAKLPQSQKTTQQPFTLGRAGWLLGIVLLVGGLMLSILFPGIWGGSMTNIRYQQGDTWVEVPSPGDMVRGLEFAADGTLWSITAGGIHRWSAAAWQTIYTTNSNLITFALDSKTLWAISTYDIVRCDTRAYTCEVARQIERGVSIAANGGRMLAVTGQGMAYAFENDVWDEFALVDVLPGFNLSDAPGYLATVAIAPDNSQWIEWGQVWRRSSRSELWDRVLYGQEAPLRFDILGTTSDHVWTYWNNGISRDEPTLSNWDFFSWEDIGNNYSNQIFDLQDAPNEDVWIATNRGLVQYGRSGWQLIPVPEASVITEVAVSPDNQLWIQTTKGGAASWLFMLGAVAAVLFVRVAFNRLFKGVSGSEVKV